MFLLVTFRRVSFVHTRFAFADAAQAFSTKRHSLESFGKPEV